MDLLEILQEQYINEFTNKVSVIDFFVNVVVVAVLTFLLRAFYIKHGTALTNRRRFAHNFLPLALGTVLIIMIVKSSIALSLGLVGALSIVRFRAAIKEPEELTYLFITIGLGLAGGANQPVLAIVAFFTIVGILFIYSKFEHKNQYYYGEKMYLNVQTDVEDVKLVANVLTEIFPFVELKRLDTLENGLDLSFVCKADNIDQVQEAQQKIRRIGTDTRLSLIEQPQLLV